MDPLHNTWQQLLLLGVALRSLWIRITLLQLAICCWRQGVAGLGSLGSTQVFAFICLDPLCYELLLDGRGRLCYARLVLGLKPVQMVVEGVAGCCCQHAQLTGRTSALSDRLSLSYCHTVQLWCLYSTCHHES